MRSIILSALTIITLNSFAQKNFSGEILLKGKRTQKAYKESDTALFKLTFKYPMVKYELSGTDRNKPTKKCIIYDFENNIRREIFYKSRSMSTSFIVDTSKDKMGMPMFIGRTDTAKIIGGHLSTLYRYKNTFDPSETLNMGMAIWYSTSDKFIVPDMYLLSQELLVNSERNILWTALSMQDDDNSMSVELTSMREFVPDNAAFAYDTTFRKATSADMEDQQEIDNTELKEDRSAIVEPPPPPPPAKPKVKPKTTTKKVIKKP